MNESGSANEHEYETVCGDVDALTDESNNGRQLAGSATEGEISQVTRTSGAVGAEKRGGTYANDHDDEENNDTGKDASFQPLLAVLKAEAHFKHIAEEVRVAGECFAHSGAGGAEERGIRREQRCKCTNREIRYRIVTIEAHMRRFVLQSTGQTTLRRIQGERVTLRIPWSPTAETADEAAK